MRPTPGKWRELKCALAQTETWPALIARFRADSARPRSETHEGPAEAALLQRRSVVRASSSKERLAHDLVAHRRPALPILVTLVTCIQVLYLESCASARGSCRRSNFSKKRSNPKIGLETERGALTFSLIKHVGLGDRLPDAGRSRLNQLRLGGARGRRYR
jgi:hypothetical protein